MHSVWPGADGKSVFIAIADLTPAMQLEVQFDLGEGWASVYSSPAMLADFAAEDREFAQPGFPARFATPLAQRAETSGDSGVSSERGAELASRYGCVGCHSLEGNAGKTGPSWRGVFNSRRRFAEGRVVIADEEYMKTSILDPANEIVPGFESREVMTPPYRGILSESEVMSIVEFIKTLR